MNQKQFDYAYGNAPLAIEFYDVDGFIQYSNAATCELFGVQKADDVVGFNMFDDPNLTDDIKRRLKAGEKFRHHLEFSFDIVKRHNLYPTSKSGWISLDVYTNPLVDDRGQHIGYLVFLHNMTALKQTEKELQQAKEAAEQANLFKSRFLANMSHEIRTPMNGLLGFVELLAKNEQDPKRIEQFNTVRSSGQSLLEIINDILDFSKVESGKMEVESMPIDAKLLSDSIIDIYASLASAKNIVLTAVIDDSIPKCFYGDQTRLKQIMFNLLGNAIKFTEAGGTVTLQATFDASNSVLRVAVIDTGIGIEKENQTKIFDPFSQEDISTTRKFGGTGLGLSISSRLVQMMGGALKVESELTKGSKFYFDIPIVVCDDCNDNIEENKELDDAEVAFSGHVLIVEDNKTNQMLLSTLLDELGITYDLAEHGADAIKRLKANSFDVIFMDENMPIMNGIEATQIIRKREEDTGEHVIIVAVTANALAKDRQRFLDAGMDDYISKPYSGKDIVNVLKKCRLPPKIR